VALPCPGRGASFTQAFLLTSAETFSDSSERDDDEDFADGVAELDRTIESVAGDGRARS
jgi:hypothetical protein